MALVNKLTAIGDAIRNKNGSTSKLTLDSMVTAINDMASVTIDGVKVKEKLDLVTDIVYENKSVSTLPYSFYDGSAVILNGEIHILGNSYSSSSRKCHYKWDGSSWSSVSALPYEFCSGSAVVLNGEIHILGSSSDSYDKYHYTLVTKIYKKVG